MEGILSDGYHTFIFFSVTLPLPLTLPSTASRNFQVNSCLVQIKN